MIEPASQPAVHLLRQLLRIQKIASRYPGHTDLDAIYDVAYNTIRDFPLEREPDTRGETTIEAMAVLTARLQQDDETWNIVQDWPQWTRAMRTLLAYREAQASMPRGEAQNNPAALPAEAAASDKLRAALWLMRRAIQRDDPVTLTPSEARALLALASPQESEP